MSNNHDTPIPNIHRISPMVPPLQHDRPLLWATTNPSAAAQLGADSSDYQYGFHEIGDFDPSMMVLIVVLVCAFFFMGFFSVYIRRCTDARFLPSSSSSAAAHNRRPRRLSSGLDPAVVESYPTFPYSAVDDIKKGAGVLECAVCISEFEDHETLRVLPNCNHVFHVQCIGVWLASHSSCPVCRADLKLAGNKGKGTSEPIDSQNEEYSNRSQLSEGQHEVSITVEEEEEEEDQNRDPEVISNGRFGTSKTPRIFEKLRRSHSTGSLGGSVGSAL